jgi:hypothetical protein
MIVALVSVGQYLLIDSSLKVPRSAEAYVELLIPLLKEDVCYQLAKQESTYRWAAGLAHSPQLECYLGWKT